MYENSSSTDRPHMNSESKDNDTIRDVSLPCHTSEESTATVPTILNTTQASPLNDYIPHEIWVIILDNMSCEERSKALSSLYMVTKNLRSQLKQFCTRRVIRLDLSFDTLVKLKTNTLLKTEFIIHGIESVLKNIPKNVDHLIFELDSLRFLVEEHEWSEFFDTFVSNLMKTDLDQFSKITKLEFARHLTNLSSNVVEPIIPKRYMKNTVSSISRVIRNFSKVNHVSIASMYYPNAPREICSTICNLKQVKTFYCRSMVLNKVNFRFIRNLRKLEVNKLVLCKDTFENYEELNIGEDLEIESEWTYCFCEECIKCNRKTQPGCLCKICRYSKNTSGRVPSKFIGSRHFYELLCIEYQPLIARPECLYRLLSYKNMFNIHKFKNTNHLLEHGDYQDPFSDSAPYLVKVVDKGYTQIVSKDNHRFNLFINYGIHTGIATNHIKPALSEFDDRGIEVKVKKRKVLTIYKPDQISNMSDRISKFTSDEGKRKIIELYGPLIDSHKKATGKKRQKTMDETKLSKKSAESPKYVQETLNISAKDNLDDIHFDYTTPSVYVKLYELMGICQMRNIYSRHPFK